MGKAAFTVVLARTLSLRCPRRGVGWIFESAVRYRSGPRRLVAPAKIRRPPNSVVNTAVRDDTILENPSSADRL